MLGTHNEFTALAFDTLERFSVPDGTQNIQSRQHGFAPSHPTLSKNSNFITLEGTQPDVIKSIILIKSILMGDESNFSITETRL